MRGLRSGFKRPFSRLSDRVGVRGRVAAPALIKFVPTTGGVDLPFTWTAPADGFARVAATGAGGRGGYAVGGGSASGGGGGGYCRKTIAVKKGDVISGIVGAAAATATTTGGLNGVAGGNSTVTFPGGSTMTARGGAGGSATTASGSQLPGGAGGTATGGDVNATGGTGAQSGSDTASAGNAQNGVIGFRNMATSWGHGGAAGMDPEMHPHGPGLPRNSYLSSWLMTDPLLTYGGGGAGRAQNSASAEIGGHGIVSILFTGLEE